MKLLNAISILMTILLGSTLYSAPRADPVNINVSGKVIAAACTIDNNGIYAVDLGQNIRSATLSDPDSSSPWKPFDVTLSHCPTGTNKVTVTFSGTAERVDERLYANASGTGYAQNVAVELQRKTGAINAGNGKSLQVDVDSARNATFDLQARLFSTAGGVTAGIISAVVVMNFTYN